MQIDADATVGHKPTWDHATTSVDHANVSMDDADDPDSDIPDELGVLESYLMVVNDLAITQAVAVLAHPDHNIVEYCMDGQIDQVRLHLNYAQQGRLYLSDSVLSECIDGASANGDLDMLELLTGAFPGRKFYHSVQAMDQASAGGHIDCLNWWLARKDTFKLRYSPAAMDSATEAGLVDVLDWWLASGLQLKYSFEGLDGAFLLGQLPAIEWWWRHRDQLDGVEWNNIMLANACRGNQVDVLQWWIDKEIPFSFDDTIFAWAADEGHVQVLDFWHKWLVEENPEILQEIMAENNIGMRCRSAPSLPVLNWLDIHGFSIYSFHWIAMASKTGQLDVLKWFFDKGLLEQWYDYRVIDNASSAGHVDILQWILTTGLAPVYTTEALNDASRNGRMDVLRWWFESGLEIKYSRKALDGASQNGHLEVLKLWKASGRPLEHSQDAIDQASKYGYLDILDWWVDEANVPLQYTEAAINGASQEGRVDVLAWWLARSKSHNLKLYYTELAFKTKFVPCLDWWLSSGLELKYSADSCIQLGDPSPIVDWWIKSGLEIKHSTSPARLGSMMATLGEVEYWEQLGFPVNLQYDPGAGWDGSVAWTPFPYIEWVGRWHYSPDDETVHIYDWVNDHAERHATNCKPAGNVN
ncbi:hypothetical protein BCR44DRAFT_1438793 [Catenaria anguillulae PL171]|uniref:Ankyrin repeat-containing domain protein n=1 Tax=Catenaria anguillulae PL171 TaxID=765915 RepID=A0A1Y2HHE3_9FUNG|nr:hypothetical protein BCR44DRAFT_1438793 [Catenaria anguillulae PL171]